jgi:hypothetical protein
LLVRESIPVDPAREPFERLGCEVHRPALGVACAGDETGGLEHLDVPRHGLHRDVERLCELVHGGGPPTQSCDDASSHGVGEGEEGAVEQRFGCIDLVHHSTLTFIN